MAFQVDGDGGEARFGEEDRGGLEGPADVITVAVDHTNEATWRGGERGPRTGEEGEASR